VIELQNLAGPGVTPLADRADGLPLGGGSKDSDTLLNPTSIGLMNCCLNE
jgi:hypothetical protein